MVLMQNQLRLVVLISQVLDSSNYINCVRVNLQFGQKLHVFPQQYHNVFHARLNVLNFTVNDAVDYCANEIILLKDFSPFHFMLLNQKFLISNEFLFQSHSKLSQQLCLF